jgi:hypothetical protein
MLGFCDLRPVARRKLKTNGEAKLSWWAGFWRLAADNSDNELSEPSKSSFLDRSPPSPSFVATGSAAAGPSSCVPKLTVEYTYAGRQYEVTIKDSDELVLP